MPKFMSEEDKRAAVAASESAEKILRVAEEKVAELLTADLTQNQLPLDLVGTCETVRSMCNRAVVAAIRFRQEVNSREVH